MIIVSVVLLISFSAIYISSANTFNRRLDPPKSDPLADRFDRLDNETKQLVDNQRSRLAERSLSELLVTLIFAAVAIAKISAG